MRRAVGLGNRDDGASGSRNVRDGRHTSPPVDAATPSSHLPATSSGQAELFRSYFRACLAGFAANPSAADLPMREVVDASWAAAGRAMELDERMFPPDCARHEAG